MFTQEVAVPDNQAGAAVRSEKSIVQLETNEGEDIPNPVLYTVPEIKGSVVETGSIGRKIFTGLHPSLFPLKVYRPHPLYYEELSSVVVPVHIGARIRKLRLVTHAASEPIKNILPESIPLLSFRHTLSLQFRVGQDQMTGCEFAVSPVHQMVFRRRNFVTSELTNLCAPINGDPRKYRNLTVTALKCNFYRFKQGHLPSKNYRGLVFKVAVAGAIHRGGLPYTISFEFYLKNHQSSVKWALTGVDRHYVLVPGKIRPGGIIVSGSKGVYGRELVFLD